MARKYIPQFELGSGAFGRAVVVKQKEKNKELVAKIIQVRNLSEVDLERCVTEVCVMASCNHRNIIQYVEAFVDSGCLQIIMEYAKGGDLHNKIENQRGKFFSTEVILDWFVQVVLALQYIHSKGILHRDLKPQNVFLMIDGTIKLGDFGIAKILSHGDDLASTRIGTPFYISPEICAGKSYNSSSDMWAAGCLLFELALLRVPFNATSLSALTKYIIQCQFDQIPRDFGPTIPTLITQLIVFEPEHRLTACQVLKHCDLSDLVMTHTRYNDDILKVNSSRSDKKMKVNTNSITKGKADHAKLNEEKKREKQCTSDSKLQMAKGREKQCILDSKLQVAKGRSSDQEGPPIEGQISLTGIYQEDLKHKHLDNKCAGCVNVGSLNGINNEQVLENVNGIQHQARLPNVQNGIERRPRTFSLKDSVVRKLSAASPKLAETVRLQRLSISEGKSNKDVRPAEYCDVTDDAVDDAIDDVFKPVLSSGDTVAGKKGGSLTYTVYKTKEDVGSRKNDENNNLEGAAEINSVLILALSLLKSNRDLAKTILIDKLEQNMGRKRTVTLLPTIRHLILSEGKTYMDLKGVLEEEEDRYIPLIAMLFSL